jgi:hypothetical protein
MSIVSLALTPVELTAARVYLEEGIDEYGQINFRLNQVSTRDLCIITVSRLTTTLIMDEDSMPSTGALSP